MATESTTHLGGTAVGLLHPDGRTVDVSIRVSIDVVPYEQVVADAVARDLLSSAEANRVLEVFAAKVEMQRVYETAHGPQPLVVTPLRWRQTGDVSQLDCRLQSFPAYATGREVSTMLRGERLRSVLAHAANGDLEPLLAPSVGLNAVATVLDGSSASGRALVLAPRTAANDAWHVAVNEGLADIDIVDGHIDLQAAVRRGFDEELNTEVMPEWTTVTGGFLDLHSFDFAVTTVSHLPMTLEALAGNRESAIDRWETGHLLSTPWTPDAVDEVVNSPRSTRTQAVATFLAAPKEWSVRPPAAAGLLEDLEAGLHARVPRLRKLSKAASVTTFEAPSPLRRGKPSQDALDSFVLPSGVRRVVVVDGVTPTADTPHSGVLDGARMASWTVLRWMRTGLSLEEAALRANDELLSDPRVRALTPRARPQTTFVAADIAEVDGQVVASLVRSGDCEAWLAQADESVPLFAGDGVAPDALAKWHSGLAALRQAVPAEALLEESQRLEQELFSSSDVYVSTPIGRFETAEVRFEKRTVVVGTDTLILSSDGAQIAHKPQSADLGEWLVDLRREEGTGTQFANRVKASDDIAVVVVGRGESLERAGELVPTGRTVEEGLGLSLELERP